MIGRSYRPSRVFSTEDARWIARRRLPRLVYDFIDGGVGREVGLDANQQAFDDAKLQPRVLANVSKRSTATTLMGRQHSLPFGMAPMGMCNLADPGTDAAMANLAKQHDLPIGLSTASSTSIEEMARISDGNAWFQLYVGQSEEAAMALVDRARNAGYQTLILTVDTPELSRRTKDFRNGFEVPFQFGPRQVFDFAMHPAWSLRRLAAGVPTPANFDFKAGKGFKRDEPRAGTDAPFLSRLRDRWQGKLVVKGVTSPADARTARDLGADAINVSNHGARQLDSGPGAAALLPAIRAALGPDTPILFDSGVRTGDDIVRALALGADFVMVGRPWLYAAGAEGPKGVQAIFDVLVAELSIVMAQIGVTATNQIGRDSLAMHHGDAATTPSPVRLSTA